MHGSNGPKSSKPVAQLFEWLHGPIYYALLAWGLKADVFTKCAQGARCEPLAEAMELDPGQLVHLLSGLVSMGLLIKERDEFRTATEFSSLLNAQDQNNMISTLKALAAIRHDGLDAMEKLGKEPCLQDDKHGLFDASHWEMAAASLASFHRACAAETMQQVLQDLPMWGEVKTLLDLGAGSATLARRIVNSESEKKVTVQDLEPLARGMEAECAADQRIEIFPGDYNAALPEGPFDMIWTSMSLYFVKGNLSEFFRRIEQVLRPGGHLVSFHEALENDRTEPKIHVIGRLMPVLKGKDFSFDKGRIRDAAMDAGFALKLTKTVSTQFGPLQLDVLQCSKA